MKKALLMIVAILFVNNLIGQTIALKQNKSNSDIKVINGDYELYFKKTDVLAAIDVIDKTLNINNSTIVDNIKANKIKTVDLGSIENKDFTALLKNNLGVYLLRKGKVSVYKGEKKILSLVQDQGPDQVELNGTRTAPVFFSEEDSEEETFLGSINAKL